MLKKILQLIVKFLFRVEVRGLENYQKAGERVLIIANHVSFLDAVLLVLFLPDKLMFAINSHIATRWYIKPLLYFVQVFSLDPTNSIATKSIIQEIRKGRKCIIFPEGRITLTGSLMKIYQGPALIAEKSGAKILPIHIDGAERSYFSKLKGIQKLSFFPKIKLNILEPVDFIVENDEADRELNARERRKLSSAKLYDIMSNMQFASASYHKTLFEALLEASRKHGSRHVIAEDKDRKPINYRELIMRSFILAQKFEKHTEQGEYVGILLPNSLAGISSFFALQAIGRVPAMLNFSTGARNIESACRVAGLRVVYTAKTFIEVGNLHSLIEGMEKNNVRVIYLENIKESIGSIDKAMGFVKSFIPNFYYKNKHIIMNAVDKENSENSFLNSQKKAKYTFRFPMGIIPFGGEFERQSLSNKVDTCANPAVVLFTSGSEGSPKGVVLSHENILANINQASARIDFGPQDILFNVLPIFHSFGLTGGTLLPILSGVRTFFYPSPLHCRMVPELIYDTRATIMFGTDTFLGNYAKYAHVYDFNSIRYIFAGAEKLKPQTREIYADTFGVRIFEGYGATETAPILSLNTPLQNKKGSVGRFLPYIDYELEKVEGVENGGKLLVKGKNIMLGYLRAENPCVIQKLENNIYDTGDIVNIDHEGYVTILGRVKRFAKIGGEMVSLTAVEEMADNVWNNASNAVLSLPDDKKGESLILMTTKKNAKREELIFYAKRHGITELYIPKKIEYIENIPLLGTGKVDYVELKRQINYNTL